MNNDCIVELGENIEHVRDLRRLGVIWSPSFSGVIKEG